MGGGAGGVTRRESEWATSTAKKKSAEGERTKFAVNYTGTQFGYKKSALLPGQCRLGIQVMPALGVRSDRTDWVEKSD